MPEALREVWLVLTEEVRRAVQRRSYIFATLAVPVGLLIILGAIVASRALITDREVEAPKPPGIVVLTEDLYPVPVESYGFQQFASREEGVAALRDDAIRGLFVVPADYVETGNVEWVHPPGGAFAGFDPGPGARGSAVSAYLRASLAAGDVPPGVLERALIPPSFDVVIIGPDGQPATVDPVQEAISLAIGLAAALLLMFAILVGASNVVQSVAEEKENRMIEVLMTSVRPFPLLAGKVLGVGVVGLAQILVWVVSLILIVPLMVDLFPGAPVLSVDLLTLLWVVAFFLAGYFIASVILAGIGAIASGVREASQLSVVVNLPLIAPVIMTTTIIAAPDGLLARLLSFIPLTAPVAMLIRLAGNAASWAEGLISLAIIVASGLLMLWLAARLFRTGLLMYGQRMGVRTIWAALRGAG